MPMRHRGYRFPCEHPVTLDLEGAVQPAQIVNISAEGARLSGPQGLAPGRVVQVVLGPGCPVRRAEVRWSRGPLTGLRFEVPLDPRVLARIRRSAGCPTAPPPKGSWNLHLRELR